MIRSVSSINQTQVGSSSTIYILEVICMTFDEMAFFHSNIFMLQTPREDDDQHNHPSTSLSTPILPPQEFHASLMGNRPSNMPFSGTGIDVCEAINNHGDHDELSDEESQMGEKKRRLNMEQVKTLEKNFELGNKLEPERKMQLARALGLQPRQIAIWFQNRRARWKTKQLEKDYEVLRKQFDAVKAENDSLQTQNQRLLAEIMALKSREPTESINLNKETEGSSSNRSENSSEIKLHISITPAKDGPFPTQPTSNTTASRPFIPSSMIRPSNGVSQLLQNSSRQEIHFPKMDHQNTVKEESSLSNMFCTMDDHTGFWPWLEQQNYN